MSESPFFSVIIPTYNRADRIGETIQSVLSQTESDFEVIVVVDGSTDQTADLMREISDHRVKYAYQSNAERAVARNLGVSISSGQYITFLDSDDVFFKEHLSTVKAALHDQDMALYFQPYCLLNPSNGQRVSLPKLWADLNLMIVKKGNVFSCHGVFLKRQIALENPFNSDRDLSGSEDYELWLRLAASVKFHAGKKVTSALIIHPGRSVYSFSPDKLIRRKELMINYIQSDNAFMNKYGQWMNLLKARSYSYIALHLPFTQEGQQLRLKYLRQSIGQHFPGIFSKRIAVIIRQLLLRR